MRAYQAVVVERPDHNCGDDFVKQGVNATGRRLPFDLGDVLDTWLLQNGFPLLTIQRQNKSCQVCSFMALVVGLLGALSDKCSLYHTYFSYFLNINI